METAQDRSAASTPDNDLDSLRAKVSQLEGQIKDDAEAKQLHKEQVSKCHCDYTFL